jgi:hypothetical protein
MHGDRTKHAALGGAIIAAMNVNFDLVASRGDSF